MLKHSLSSISILLIILCGELQSLESLAQVQGGNGLPSPVTVPGGRVVLYSGIKYTGRARSFNPGSFGPTALGLGLARNVSSIQIPPGWYLTATARDGRQHTFTRSNAMLSGMGWDNVLVSGIVGRGNPGGSGGSHGGNGRPPIGAVRPVAILYYALDFGGQSLPFGTGSFGSLGGDAATNITAIYVSPGYAVRVYDQLGLRGRSQTFTTSVSDLRRYDWNDRVASIRVLRGPQSGQSFGKP